SPASAIWHFLGGDPCFGCCLRVACVPDAYKTDHHLRLASLSNDRTHGAGRMGDAPRAPRSAASIPCSREKGRAFVCHRGTRDHECCSAPRKRQLHLALGTGGDLTGTGCVSPLRWDAEPSASLRAFRK